MGSRNGVENFPIALDVRFKDEYEPKYVITQDIKVDEINFKFYHNAHDTEPCIWLDGFNAELYDGEE